MNIVLSTSLMELCEVSKLAVTDNGSGVVKASLLATKHQNTTSLSTMVEPNMWGLKPWRETYLWTPI